MPTENIGFSSGLIVINFGTINKCTVYILDYITTFLCYEIKSLKGHNITSIAINSFKHHVFFGDKVLVGHLKPRGTMIPLYF